MARLERTRVLRLPRRVGQLKQGQVVAAMLADLVPMAHQRITLANRSLPSMNAKQAELMPLAPRRISRQTERVGEDMGGGHDLAFAPEVTGADRPASWV
jgi:hypothetical protein